MKLDAADLLRKALEGSAATSGYKVVLERLKVHSIKIQGDVLVVGADRISCEMKNGTRRERPGVVGAGLSVGKKVQGLALGPTTTPSGGLR